LSVGLTPANPTESRAKALTTNLFDQNKLSKMAFDALDQSIHQGGQIYISSISLIEIIYLVEKGRLPTETTVKLTEALQDPQMGIELIPIDIDIASAIASINRDAVPDMPDRIIAATALTLHLPLVTRDAKIQQALNIQTIW
jgi:predicted nucleic acid-binding protein